MFLVIVRDTSIDTTLIQKNTHIFTLNDTVPNILLYSHVIILGGDGTILRFIQRYKNLPPIIPINYGTLGFLTTFSPYTFNINKINTYKIVKRQRLLLNNNLYFLNEIVITSKIRLLNKFTIFINNKKIHINGDSIIVSTMTGSSAYNHSAGGPLLLTDNCLIVNVLNPNKSLFKPLICSVNDKIKIESNKKLFCIVDGIEHEIEDFSISYDGNILSFLCEDDFDVNCGILKLINPK